MQFSIFIALRYFLTRKNEKLLSIITFISLCGIITGVAALIVVMSVMHGFHIDLIKNIVGLNGDINITLDENSDRKKIVGTIKEQKFVTHVVLGVNSQALAINQPNSTGVIIKGIDIEDILAKKQIYNNILYGNLKNFNEEGVVLGNHLAAILRVRVGQKIKLLSPKLLSTVVGYIPRIKEFTVVCIFQTGYYDYDSSVILIPLSTAKKFNNSNENEVEIFISNPDQIDINSSIIQNLLLEIGDMNSDVTNWKSKNTQLLKALKIEKTSMFVILSLIIVVAAFNIVSSLFMFVKEKNKDIAILKTIGVSNKQILFIFVITGALIGIIGTAIGTVIGVLIANNIDKTRIFLERLSDIKILNTELFSTIIYFLSNLPSKIEISDVIYIALLSISISLLASLYPAYKAMKLDPIKIIRND